MHRTMVMTLLGPDRPGLVEALAEKVQACDGNWLESRLCQLAGHFAGIVQLQLPEARAQEFEAALRALDAEMGLKCHLSISDAGTGEGRLLTLDVIGQDRPGIVFAVTDILAEFGVNVEAMDSVCESAPMSGESLFRARLRVRIPLDTDFSALERRLTDIGDEMMLDVCLDRDLDRAAD